MSHFRRTLLTALVLVVVITALAGYAGHSAAGSFAGPPEPIRSGVPLPPQDVPNPNTGEPDSGSTHSTSTSTNAVSPTPKALALARVLGMIRWTSIVWAKSILGIGE